MKNTLRNLILTHERTQFTINGKLVLYYQHCHKGCYCVECVSGLQVHSHPALYDSLSLVKLVGEVNNQNRLAA